MDLHATDKAWKPPMSRGAADALADRLENGEPVIRSADEKRLIVAALRFYANSKPTARD